MKSVSGPIGPRGAAVLAAAAVAGVILGVHGWTARHAPGALGSIGRSGPAASSGGPLLSSQAFAPYSYRVWPGRPSQAATAAATGLIITVHRQGSGLSLSVAVNGQLSGSPRYYATGATVYVVEAALGDESGNSDYNLGDDGIVVTDAKGRIVS